MLEKSNSTPDETSFAILHQTDRPLNWKKNMRDFRWGEERKKQQRVKAEQEKWEEVWGRDARNLTRKEDEMKFGGKQNYTNM